MKIYSMTATFGKLDRQTLTFQPGLNIIEAPNEWGKSTWCAFLINMLYGIDTRARVNGSVLPDKERYAPWSGAAMSGRIDLNWNGKDITIERTSNARTPMGIFKAYETESGLDIPELNGANCGQMLLGVERSVFAKAGFLRLADLPVTQDDALRRRLNNLVTTGDESDTGDKLAKTLKDLKNKCKSNSANGLIPEAEKERNNLRQQLYSLQDLGERTQQLQTQQAELSEQLHALEVHQQALDYAAAQQDAQKVADADRAAQTAQKHLEELTLAAQALPSAEDAQIHINIADRLQAMQQALLDRQQTLPPKPEQPEIPNCFAQMQPDDAIAAAKEDFSGWQMLSQQKGHRTLIPVWAMITVLALAAAAVCQFVLQLGAVPVWGIAAGLILLSGGIIIPISANLSKKHRKQLEELTARHPGQTPEYWVANAESYAQSQAAYNAQLEAYMASIADFTAAQEDYNAHAADFAGDSTIAQRRATAAQALQLHRELSVAEREAQRTAQHANMLRALVKEVTPPQEPDSLLYSAQTTKDLLVSARAKQQQLNMELAQCEGQMTTQGQEPAIRAQIDALNQRIAQLETYYSALEMAQGALQQASDELQRRFAPKISQRAQELFSKLTDGRYRRITMAADMTLRTTAENETTSWEAQRRSDGTVDQLYLALRLAVAEELTPEAPLILDDALVRFDDKRLASAMDILKEEAHTKQVIVFTCQSREKQI